MFINKLNTEEVMKWVNGTFPYPPLIDHSCNPSQYKYENTLLDYVYENHKLPSEYNSDEQSHKFKLFTGATRNQLREFFILRRG